MMFEFDYNLRPILEVAKDLGLEPVSQSSNEYAYLCPVHKDTEPSLFINDDKQLFFCQGCERGGNAVGLAIFLGADRSIAYDTEKPKTFKSRPFNIDSFASTLPFIFFQLSAIIDRLDPTIVRDLDMAVVNEDDDSVARIIDKLYIKLWSKIQGEH